MILAQLSRPQITGLSWAHSRSKFSLVQVGMESITALCFESTVYHEETTNQMTKQKKLRVRIPDVSFNPNKKKDNVEV